MSYHNKISRQLTLFMLIGFAQFGTDTMLLWLWVSLGVPVAGANVLARALAACAGLYLNKTFTFRATEVQSGQPFRLYARYWLFWGAMTALSTALLKAIPLILSFEYTERSSYIVITKVGVEILLFILSFILSRQLVFRNA